MKKTGLLFGSFNPVHIGHLALANYILEYSNLEEIWFVVSPHNPFKESKELISEEHRLKMMQIAIKEEPRFKASDVEFSMPRPSYTIDTLDKLKELHLTKVFSIIIGADNLQEIHKWKEAERLTATYSILCYPRGESQFSSKDFSPKIPIIEAPLFDISATLIRQALEKDKNIRFLLPHGVYDYIKENHLYLK